MSDLLYEPDAVERGFRADGFETRRLRGRTWRSGVSVPFRPCSAPLAADPPGRAESYAPRVLITHSDAGGLLRVLHTWAQERGVVGVVLQEGATARRRPGYVPGPSGLLRLAASRLFRAIGPPMLSLDFRSYEYATHALVWGEAMRRQLLAGRRGPDYTHVVGSPAFDHIRERSPLVSEERRAVLFAQQHQPNDKVEAAACRELVTVCADQLGCRLMFRPHPRGGLRPDDIRALAASTNHPDLVETAAEGDFVDHLRSASVFVTYYSTSAYYAAVAGLPIVLIDWVSPAYELDAPDYGAALSVKTPAALGGTLRSALDDPATRRRLHMACDLWLRDHLGPLDGHGADRAARVVGQLARAPRRGSD